MDRSDYLKGRGFKSQLVHFFLLYNYGIGLSSLQGIVGQIQQQWHNINQIQLINNTHYDL